MVMFTKDNLELLRIMTHVGNPMMNLLFGDGHTHWTGDCGDGSHDSRGI